MLDTVRASPRDKERSRQFQLNRLNSLRFNPDLPSSNWKDEISETGALALIEGDFLEEARTSIADRAARAPTDPQMFIEWFEELKNSGPRFSPGSPTTVKWTK